MQVDLFTILKQLLSNYNVQITPFNELEKNLQSYNDLRMSINPDFEWDKAIKLSIKNFYLNGLNIVMDFMGIQFAIFKLPNDKEYIIIGPYRIQNIETIDTQNFIEYGYHLDMVQYIKQELLNIPFLNEEVIDIQIASILSALYPKGKFEIKHIVEHSPLNVIPGSITLKKKTMSQSMELIEKRYKIENDFLDSIRLGDATKAMKIMSRMHNTGVVERFFLSLRTQKNSMIIMNTLLRKEIEKANVHPYFIDQISAKYAEKIEMIATEKELYELNFKMVHDYCECVHKHSLKKYSPTIQKIIHYINLNISNDLSLDEIASLVNMNTSYVSTLFKSETGTTILYYINYQRIRHAAHLLRNTQSNVSTIAQSVGIYDLNYFSRLFKKYMSYSPTQYRKMVEK